MDDNLSEVDDNFWPSVNVVFDYIVAIFVSSEINLYRCMQVAYGVGYIHVQRHNRQFAHIP